MLPKSGNSTISMREVIIALSFSKNLNRETTFFEASSWSKVNYLGLALVMALKFYANVAKGLKLKVRMCWGLIPTFVEVTGEKLVGSLFALLSPIQNRVNLKLKAQKYIYICTT